MVRQACKHSLLCTLLCAMVSLANPAGGYSLRAKQQYSNGNIQSAYMLTERAYAQALQQANEQDQAILLLNMCYLEMQAMRYTAADSILGILPPGVHTRGVQLMEWQAKITLANKTGQFAQAVKLFKAHESSIVGCMDTVYCQAIAAEAVVALAAANKTQFRELGELLQQSTKGKPGRYNYAMGRAHMALGQPAQALLFLQQALTASQEANASYAIGSILYLVGKALDAMQKPKDAAYAFKQSWLVFRELGLPEPFIQSANEYLKLENDENLKNLIHNVRKEFRLSQ